MPAETDKLILGVDGGGTKTVCWLARVAALGEPADVIGMGRGGPSNPKAIGVEAACASINASIDAAFAAADMNRTCVAAVAFGLAGAGEETTQRAIEAWADSNSIARTTRVIPDCDLVLEAGTRDGVGVALIAGTGSLAYGRNVAGRMARAGGWGYLLGDDGSGFAIGRAAVRHLLRTIDQGDSSDEFSREVLGALGAANGQEAIAMVYSAGDARSKLAALAPIVSQLAESGDVVAREILKTAGNELAALVATVARRLKLEGRPLPLALAGGVLLGAETLRCELQASLVRDAIEIETTLVPDPVAGALKIAGQLFPKA